jgi:hypothetical protein
MKLQQLLKESLKDQIEISKIVTILLQKYNGKIGVTDHFVKQNQHYFDILKDNELISLSDSKTSYILNKDYAKKLINAVKKVG